MPTIKTLTGATRYRTERRLFKPDVLVLQVQEHTTDGPPDSYGMPEYLSGTYWRDARAEDFMRQYCVCKPPRNQQTRKAKHDTGLNRAARRD